MRRTSIPPAQNSICLTVRTALTKLCFYHLEQKQQDYGNGNKLQSLESFTYRKGILFLELQHNFIVHTTARFHAAFKHSKKNTYKRMTLQCNQSPKHNIKKGIVKTGKLVMLIPILGVKSASL